MNIAMYKSNREKKDKSFWGKKDLFYNSVEFDKNKAIEYFHTLKLTESDKCEFIEQFINFYLPYKFNDKNQYWFNKSVDFIEEVMGIPIQVLYKFTLEHIAQFKQKEDFEIFYYFKDLDILQDGYNNIFSELLTWFSHNEKIIDALLQSNDKEKEKDIQITQLWLIGAVGFGKSYYVKQQLLKEGCVVISKKDMKLDTFHEQDKEYFYQLLINLTPGKTKNNLLDKIEENRSNIEFKSISSYIEKRLRFECLSEKMAYKKDKKIQNKVKVLKI